MRNSKPRLIGLAGKARVGKDTAADALTRQYGLARWAFANPVKRGIEAMLGFDPDELSAEEKEDAIGWLMDGDQKRMITPRTLMQTLGTEWGRKMIHPNLWVMIAKNEWDKLTQFAPNCAGMVITDVRFDSEANWIRSEGGEIWHIKRPDAPEVANHSSEQGVRSKADEIIIRNDSTIEVFQAKISKLMKGCASVTP